MKQMWVTISLIILSSLFSGCATMYQGTLDENPKLNKQTSVILVGVQGSKSVDYLQYCAFSCKNYRITPISNEIIALKIDSPVSNIKLEVYTLAGVLAGYTPQGTNYGYKTTENPPININKTGIYYHGILNTDTGSFSTTLNHKLLSSAKAKYNDKLGSLKPINFQW
jgi:hypothetical protein